MTLIAVTIHKETKEVKVGIKFKQGYNGNDGPVCVKEIVPNSIFHKSAPQIKPGMFVISINNVPCNRKIASEVAELIKEAEGTIIVLVETHMTRATKSFRGTVIVNSIHKESKEVKAGIRFTQDNNGLIRVQGIVPDSLFATNAPEIQPGMIIFSINNVQCTGKASSEVAQLIREAEGTITILAYEQLSTTAERIVIHKETEKVDPGMVTSHIYFQEVPPDSLFQSAERIQPGTRIISINDVKCDGKTPSEVTQLINDIEGPVNMLVDNSPVTANLMNRDIVAPDMFDPESLEVAIEMIMCCCCPSPE